MVERSGCVWRESDLGYADALRKLTPGTVTSTTEETGVGIRLDTGVVVIHPALDEVYEVYEEVAEIVVEFRFNVKWVMGAGSCHVRAMTPQVVLGGQVVCASDDEMAGIERRYSILGR